MSKLLLGAKALACYTLTKCQRDTLVHMHSKQKMINETCRSLQDQLNVSLHSTYALVVQLSTLKSLQYKLVCTNADSKSCF